MSLQELNLIVTIKQSKEVLFQIAPVSKEKLQKIKGLHLGKIMPESSQMKCKSCQDQVKINLFWTKSMVVIGNNQPSKPQLEPLKTKLNKGDAKRDALGPKSHTTEKIKKEVFDTTLPMKEIKQEKDLEEIIDKDIEHIQKSEAESEYEIPKWCEPTNVPKTKPTERSREYPRDLCHICSKYIRREWIKDHIFKHEIANQRPFECNECDKSFSRVPSLHDHLVQKHFPALAQFLCSHCPSVYLRKSLLQKHLYDKHRIGQSRDQICPQCNLVFANKGSLKSHITNMHTDPSQKQKYTCEECSKIFFKKWHYKSHIKIHLPENERPYRCFCGKSFIHPFMFKRHQLEHENPEQVLVRCKVCNKGFKYTNSLTVHMRIHTGMNF